MARTTFTWISRTVLVAALGMLSAGAASGAAFRLHYDPQFLADGVLNNLGFQGDGIFHLDDTCLGNEGLIVPSDALGSNCTASGIGFDSLTLDLYNFSVGPSPTLEIVSFVPPLDPAISTVGVRLIIADHTVASIDTDFIGPVSATAISGLPIDPLPAASHLFLQFFSDNIVAHPFSVDGFARLKICDLNNDNCTTSDPATVTFTRITEQSVPEPASMLLLLGALGVFGWMQRRRDRA